jgi:nucleoside-diphosphate-sugar epimerase
MRVLLLGATGNLGLRCIAALVAHNHVITLYVRNPEKLRSLVPTTLLKHVSIVVGDATDFAGIKRALLDHNVEGIIDVAGNQVWPWQEYLMPRIAKAVSDAAIAVGEKRGEPLRAWMCCGLGIMELPGIPGRIQD